jgi:predicted TIM-barrel fold metal-dependent hydrolase
MRLVAAAACLWLAALPARAADLPVFDAHLHYNAEAQQPYPLSAVLELFRRNGVHGILANSRPNDGSWKLFEARSEALWVVPFMRPYRTRADIPTWFEDPEILALIESELARRHYFGIGEFHVHGRNAAGPQMKRVVDLAVARDIWVHAHCDVEALETIHAHNPRVKVIWAHTGFGTPPDTVRRLLEAHPALMGELSYRSGITEGDRLSPAWRALFVAHGDRFLIGSDTWINERWASYSALIDGYRAWLAQLPRETAEKIAFRNAERIFARR